MSKQSRRQLIGAVGTGVAGALTGCSGVLGGGGAGDPAATTAGGRGPVETVRRFTVAVNEDRLDDARALLHPDSSIEAAEVDDIPDPTLTLVGSGDAEATVDVATDSIEVHVILRRREGEWLVYGSE